MKYCAFGKMSKQHCGDRLFIIVNLWGQDIVDSQIVLLPPRELGHAMCSSGPLAQVTVAILVSLGNMECQCQWYWFSSKWTRIEGKKTFLLQAQG